MMSLQELAAVVPPPKEPFELGNLKSWPQIEKELGIALPSDYREMVLVYGTGKIGEFLYAYNPFSKREYSNLAKCVKRIGDVLRELKGVWEEEMPYDVFPNKPGLLPWGGDDNGNWYYWLADDGSPDKWPVIIGSGRDPRWQQFDGTMTTFLAKALQCKIKCNLWPRDFPDPKNPKQRVFRPFDESTK